MLGKLGFIRGFYKSNKQLLKVIKTLPKYHNIVEYGNLELAKKLEAVRNPSHTILLNVGLGRSAITKNYTQDSQHSSRPRLHNDVCQHNVPNLVHVYNASANGDYEDIRHQWKGCIKGPLFIIRIPWLSLTFSTDPQYYEVEYCKQ